MIRKAKPDDVEAVTKLAIEALEIDAYEELVISKDKVLALTKEAVSSAQHFVLVSEQDGVIVGVIAALVYPMMFHERSQATVAMWYCKEGGEGMLLMREFLQWAEGRPMIKQLQYAGERKGEPGIVDVLMKRYGFTMDVPFLYRNR